MNSHLPDGRLAEQLGSLSRERVWLAIVMVTAGIVYGDSAYPEIGFAPLYMPIICGACWSLGARAGYFVAIVTAVLAALPLIEGASSGSFASFAIGGGVRIVSFVFIAATVISFRRSYDRQLFNAHRDRLTGALNKEIFQRRYVQALENAQHLRRTLLLIILDLDDFKAVNSRDGHLAGDDVLCSFAEGASALIRREDLFGRIGGDEFALLFRVPSIAEGRDFARDFHARLTAILGASQPPVTCSMGALLIPPEASGSAEGLMHAADMTMYRAKGAGKNTLEIAEAGNAVASRPFAGSRRKVLA